MMKTLWLMALTILVGAGLLLGVEYMREASLASSCIGAGGSYDYVKAVCEHDAVHPEVSFFSRHVAGVWFSLLPLLLVSGVSCWRQFTDIMVLFRPKSNNGMNRTRNKRAS
jgi:hypothetical protein